MRFHSWLKALQSRLHPTCAKANRPRMRRPAKQPPLRLEPLEDRLAPAVFLVDTPADSGTGSLRQAILDANATPNDPAGPDVIQFRIGSGVQTIAPTSALPQITDPVTIDGWSQPGFAGTPLIELDGEAAGNADGIYINVTAPDTTVRGLVINRFTGTGIVVNTAPDTWFYGNYIGLDPTGTASYEGNATGIFLYNVAGATVGSNGDGVDDLLERNVISGQYSYPTGGVYTYVSTDVTIRGNYFGTDATGAQVIQTGHEYPTGNGNSSILSQGSTNLHVIDNLVSGGSYFGILMFGDSHPVIQGNRVGTNAAGTAVLGGAGAGGIWMQGGTNDAVIGGTLPGEGNLVSGNWNGIVAFDAPNLTIQGNLVGTNATGSSAIANQSAGIIVAGAGSTNVVMGGTTHGAGNLISGNGYGIQIAETNGPIRVEGNAIGTDLSRTYAVGNGIGIDTRAATHVTIGGTDSLARNLISGNNSWGVIVDTQDNALEGNFIGTNDLGTGAIPNQGNGVGVFGTGNLVLNNLISGNNVFGVQVSGTANVVQGNTIGTDVTGNAAVPNRVSGVWLYSSQNGLISGNLISGNLGNGVDIEYPNDSTGNRVQGNRIGTNAAGTAALGNGGDGVLIYQNHDNLIGGTGPGEGNVISGNAGDGIGIGISSSTGNAVYGNFIGTDTSGTLHLGNGHAGVYVFFNGNNDPIGGVGSGQANTIAFNGSAGVLLEQASAITIRGNSIHDNTGLGISLGYYGANNSQPAPVVTGSNGGAHTHVVGSLTAAPNATFALDFYANASPDPSGFGEGQRYLGTLTVTTDGSGYAAFDATVPGASVAGQFVTATATDAGGNTSGFSGQAVVVNAPPVGVAGGPYSILLGQPVTLDGSGSSDPDGDPLTYSWTINGHAGAASGVGPTLSGAQLASFGITVPGSYPVIVVVNDGQGHTVASSPGTLTVLAPATVSGLVFADFNGDGQVDFGESGIGGVAVTLDGTDDLGHHVHLPGVTDGSGTYLFSGLRPGTYSVAEAQPAGYTQGVNTIGTAAGGVSGDTFTGIVLAAGQNGLNYNFGETPPASGAVHRGQAAGIGFWNNKNGQALIKALNGGTGTELGDWLAATLPHLFGDGAGSNKLHGKTNAQVAAYYQGLFAMKGPKAEAQLLATALAVYVTNSTLDTTGVGAQYGFQVTASGLGTATWSVGSNGAAFGVANNTTLTVLELLHRADAASAGGFLFNGDAGKKQAATDLFGGINDAGGI